jgi:hypothetical protein
MVGYGRKDYGDNKTNIGDKYEAERRRMSYKLVFVL